MNKYITLSLLSLAAMVAQAQDFDTKPTLQLDNKEQDVHFTIGARMMTDAAYYHSDFTPMHSGAALTDARIRTSMTYRNWYFYADFGFGKGKFDQKNIFLQYAAKDKHEGEHAVKVGYFTDPAGRVFKIGIKNETTF